MKRMKRVRVERILAAFLFSLGAGPVRAAPPTVLTWPEEWKVFLPVARTAEAIAEEVRASIPETLTVNGVHVEGRWVRADDVRQLHGHALRLEGTRLDLAPLFGGVAQGNTAYIFLPITADRPGRIELGFGADWWMQAWWNGVDVLDTTETGGNTSWPPMIDNRRVEVQAEAGLNVLAVRFISGAGSSVLTVGGPHHLAEVDRLMAEAFPEPGEDQATATANRALDWSLPEVDFSAGALAGIEPLPSRQMYYAGADSRGRHSVRDWETPRFDSPVRLRLSKRTYPAEDLHLDAMLWLSPEADAVVPEGHLDLVLRDGEGAVVAEGRIDALHPSGLFFSMGLPSALHGRAAVLEAVWRDRDGEPIGSAAVPFRVSAPEATAPSGTVALTVPNSTGAVLARAPMTIGVPFPRGALTDPNRVRLVDESGEEIALQTRVSARWSRFGPIRWLLCDFTLDLAGAPRSLRLEYGPEVTRASIEPMQVESAGRGFPGIEAGRLRVSDDGVWFDVDGTGRPRRILEGAALTGAFVEHEDGRRYEVPRDAQHVIEERGSEKVVVRRTGWYRERDGDRRFCNYVTRMVFHRDSPVIRIYHTWIFTGDGNRDRISSMGWSFGLPEDLRPGGVQLTRGDAVEWAQADALVQWNYEGMDLVRGSEVEVRDTLRAPGVAAVTGDDAQLFFGVKDFWQNFPSELSTEAGALTFYNWPRRNRPPSFERPVRVMDVVRHRFAHEGVALDFRLPEEYTGEEIWATMSGRRGASSHFAFDRPETANAQGIARTEEMFLLLAGPDMDRDAAARVLQGLDEETLRPVVDPAWMAATGVFGRIHPKDPERFPEDERVYEEVCRAPLRWVERLGVYGMWVFGDYPAWDMRLAQRQSSPYRAYRKNHHGWPVRWLPYARSGEAWLLKMAEAATRQMTDASFCHYASADVNEATGSDYTRQQGWWNRSILPWAGLPHGQRGPGTRFYAVESDYLWHSYYITGARRGRDVALLYADLVPWDTQRVLNVDRVSQSMFSSFLELYQATYNPWFLVSVDAFRDMYLAADHWRDGFWRNTERDYIAFSGCDEFRNAFLERIDPERRFWGHEQGSGWGGAAPGIAPRIEPQAAGWHLTGNAYYLGRLVHEIDRANMAVYEGEVEYWRGTRFAGGTGNGAFTGWYMFHFPYALAALADAGERPDSIPNQIPHRPLQTRSVRTEDGGTEFETQLPTILLNKQPGRTLDLYLRTWRADSGSRYAVLLEGPDGHGVLSDAWAVTGARAESVPAEAAAGIYRLQLEGRIPRSGRGHVLFPVAHRDVPEVFVLPADPEGTRLPPVGGESQTWFRVPEDVESFWVEFPVGEGDLRRMSVWNPAMERVWDASVYEPEYEGPRPLRAEVAVSPGHAGALWRVTAPNHDGFRLDPAIPPVFSVSRSKWFDPASCRTGAPQAGGSDAAGAEAGEPFAESLLEIQFVR